MRLANPMERAAEKLKPKLVQFRVVDGRKLSAIAHFPFMMQLMASLESIRASLRWLEFIDGEDSTVRARDRFTILITGAGWSAEAFHLLKKGSKRHLVERSMIEDDEKLAALWDRVMSDPQDELLRSVHRIRDKYFVHWDRRVMEEFIKLQAKEVPTEPFMESDAGGKFLNTRYLWPNAAFAVNLFGAPAAPEFEQETRRLLSELSGLWPQTANLLGSLLCTLIKKSGLEFEPVALPGT